MTTIDNLDIGVYVNYARRMQSLEQINKEYRLQEASSIPPQTAVLDLYPKLSELDILLGVARTYAPWALFLPPKRYREQRKSPFSFSRVAPSFGSDEEQEEDMAFLQTFQCKDRQEDGERKVILKCFQQMEQINDWLGEIVGKMGQFLQG